MVIVKKRNALFTILRYILIIGGLLFFLFPIYWLITSSFKVDVDIFSLPDKLFIFKPTFENFRKIFTETNIPKLTVNSLITASLNVVLSLSIGTIAAYGISRYRVGGDRLLFWFLSLRMIPPIVVSIPLFLTAARLRLVDTRIILPIMYLLLNIPFVVWMMKSFIDEIPKSVEESAFIDGCSVFQVIRYIVFPMIKPGLVATGVFCFIFSWNEFLLAMIFTRIRASTLPIGISGFIAVEQIFWGPLTASATVAALPPIILAWIFQRYMVRGLTFGAVKT